MEIQTKYNIGDTIFIKKLNIGEVKGIVLYIHVKVAENRTLIEYLIKFQGFVLLKFTEEELNKLF